MGSKLMDAKTPVSMPAIVTVLPVNVLTGTLVRLAKASDHVVGFWLNHLVVTVNVVVTVQTVTVHVMV